MNDFKREKKGKRRESPDYGRLLIWADYHPKEKKERGKKINRLTINSLREIGWHLVPGTGFPENQSTNDAISTNILQKLRNPKGIIIIMHHRGEVNSPYIDQPFNRGSIWCEQEVGIIAFQKILGHEIPLRIYAQKGIKLEGLRAILPKTIYFEKNEEILTDLEEWLKTFSGKWGKGQVDLGALQKQIEECEAYWGKNGTPIPYLKTSGLTDDQKFEVYKATFLRKKPYREFDEGDARKKLAVKTEH